MRVVEINSVFNGSTGKIMLSLAEVGRENHVNIFCCAASHNDSQYKNIYKIGTKQSRRLHALMSYLGCNPECHSTIATNKLIKYISKINPDVIHIHNMHGFFLNVGILFNYIKKRRIPVVLTLHDCWTFTGRCPYFDLIKCNQWKNGCNKCKYPKELYPRSIVDISSRMWKLKKKWFTGVNNMTIVTPSQWLADLVKQSYLREYPVMVIRNGIDLSIFHPTISDFRANRGISDSKYIILGVAFGWGVRKGLDVFIELSKRLDSKQYQIVLVGTDSSIDNILPKDIISIHRIQNQKELAEIYTAADLFVNPTREDNYPTVNMESIACGTPVLTFRTGGSPEIVDDTCGSVVDCDDLDSMEREIVRICSTKPFTQESCLARAKKFNMNDRFQEYIKLYKEVASD